MKLKIWNSVVTATLFSSLVMPVGVTAQDNPSQDKSKHHQYKLIDTGTFGGPNSSVPIVFYEINGTAGARAISEQGTVTGTADTATADPFLLRRRLLLPERLPMAKGCADQSGRASRQPVEHHQLDQRQRADCWNSLKTVKPIR